MLLNSLRQAEPDVSDAAARAKQGVIRLVALGCFVIGAVLWIRNSFWIPSEPALARMRTAELVSVARQHPDSEPVYVALGLRLQQEGRPFEAVTAFEQAFTNDRHSARSLEGAANTLAGANQRDEAEKYFTWCLRVDPEHGTARWELGCLYESLGRWGEAEQQFQWVVQHTPQDARAWLQLGECQARLGRSSQAVSALQHAADLEPGNADYRAALQRAQTRLSPESSP